MPELILNLPVMLYMPSMDWSTEIIRSPVILVVMH